MLGDSEQSGLGSSNSKLWPVDFLEKFQSNSLARERDSSNREASGDAEYEYHLSQAASQILWSTGTLSDPIPNGFYSVIPDKKFKDLFDTIPSLDDLYALGMDSLRADIIIVDTEKDKKLTMVKQLSAALVKGVNSNPHSLIKRIAGLVADFYKRPELSPNRAAVHDISNMMESRGVQFLGQIRHGSCRPRAILFKVLADAVGLESKLVMGIPGDGAVDSCKHMSVIVVVNSEEHLVDLMRFPGHLIPFSAKAIFMSHMSDAGESDSLDNDSHDSPLVPNSPDPSEKLDSECTEHTLSQAHVRSTPVCDKKYFRSIADGIAVSRLDVAPLYAARRRLLRRNMSISPEIGDDVARAVRAMNESLKQNRLLDERGDSDTSSHSRTDMNVENASPKNISGYHTNSLEEGSGRLSCVYSSRKQIIPPRKSISLPSSRQESKGQTSGGGGTPDSLTTEDPLSIWDKVLQSSSFLNKPLIPFQQWNIDFSELTVGARVGIGFFGEVFRGIWNGTDVAIKVFLEQDLTAENMEDFCNEISILSCLRHPNVILFLGACIKPPHLSMVTEYMEMGSLYYLIHMSGQKKKLSWRRRLKFLRDICRGLMCIHRMNIIHRDVKSANCLVDKHWTVKICDFGLSQMMFDTPLTDNSSAGTPEWMAPELIRNEPFTEKCDIFSLGVIMWELCTFSRPWDGIPPVQVVYAVANQGSRLEIPEGPLGKLIADCWAEPESRPSCHEILARLLDCEYTLC